MHSECVYLNSNKTASEWKKGNTQTHRHLERCEIKTKEKKWSSKRKTHFALKYTIYLFCFIPFFFRFVFISFPQKIHIFRLLACWTAELCCLFSAIALWNISLVFCSLLTVNKYEHLNEMKKKWETCMWQTVYRCIYLIFFSSRHAITYRVKIKTCDGTTN